MPPGLQAGRARAEDCGTYEVLPLGAGRYPSALDGTPTGGALEVPKTPSWPPLQRLSYKRCPGLRSASRIFGSCHQHDHHHLMLFVIEKHAEPPDPDQRRGGAERPARAKAGKSA